MEKEFSVVLRMADYIREFRDAGRFIEYCKACGQYGTCWACPPFDFDTDKVLGLYDSILLVAMKIDVRQLQVSGETPVRQGKDVASVQQKAGESSDVDRRMSLLDRVRAVMDRELLEKEAELMGRAFFAGTCRLCEDSLYTDDAASGGCTRRHGLPCRHPDKVRPSLESFGFDIGKTTRELFGIELQWGGNVSMPEYYVLVGAVAYKVV